MDIKQLTQEEFHEIITNVIDKYEIRGDLKNKILDWAVKTRVDHTLLELFIDEEVTIHLKENNEFVFSMLDNKEKDGDNT